MQLDATTREKISELSLAVNDFLRGYVRVHDYVFATLIRRLIPIPFLFKPINISKALSALNLADSGLEQSTEAASDLVEVANRTQGEYLRMLIEYVAALRTTINLFRVILVGLNDKLGGKRRYTWRAYRRDVASYQQSVETYVNLGGPLKKKLNSLGT